jgi:hypothetical protein
MFDEQLKRLAAQRAHEHGPPPTVEPLPNGGYLISVPEIDIGPGWNKKIVTVIMLAPPGYPSAQPDCFWVEPSGLRLENGGTPQNTNDSNPIPGDVRTDRLTTWFSWHLQSWNPNTDHLVTFFKVVMQRLKPAR